MRQDLPVRYEIAQWVVPGWRSARGADPGRLGELADLGEDPTYAGGRGDKGDDAHVGAVAEADERQGEELNGR